MGTLSGSVVRRTPTAVAPVAALNYVAAGLALLLGPAVILFNDTGNPFIRDFWWQILVGCAIFAGLSVSVGIALPRGKKLAWVADLTGAGLVCLVVLWSVVDEIVRAVRTGAAPTAEGGVFVTILVAVMALVYLAPFAVVLIVLTRKDVRAFFG